MKHYPKRIAVLGSTGSIGTQTLDVIRTHPELFKAEVLTAGSNADLAIRQSLEFRPRLVVMADDKAWRKVSDALRGTGIEVAAGADMIASAAADDNVDTVLTALVGYSGLVPTLAAIDAGKTIALANKETLVAGGEIVERHLAVSKSKILPVDSEHSAIFQCLNGENMAEAARIILTASGGPFRTLTKEQLENVTVEQALDNPNWDMGAKVTIDSASMMNKGFEMIEARWLFGRKPEEIDIVVHPQSVIHSMVEFVDGSVMAHLAVPNMHVPIRYALSWPRRLVAPEIKRLSLTDYGSLTFERPDLEKFPLLSLAYEAIEAGGNLPCILNAANEVAVATFLQKRIRFVDIPTVVRRTIDSQSFISEIDLETLMSTNASAREKAENIVSTFQHISVL